LEPVKSAYIRVMRWKELRDEPCPVARGLSVIGDRWTVLILRDCFQRVRRFEQFQQRLGVTRHVLANRLRKLEDAGVLRKERYQERPPRYEYRLTEAGKELYPVLVSLIKWANEHVPSTVPSSFLLVSRATGEPITPLLIDENTGEPITPHAVRAN
jgi:DNA-binding HxlR family transcriptional regulator